MAILQRPHSGVLHHYKYNLTAFEFGEDVAKNSNVLVVIGGLGDGLLSVPWVLPLSAKLSSAASSWSIIQPIIRSSYSQWGTSSLSNDMEDLKALVKYLKSIGRGRIVLAGHSTGSQDVLSYLSTVGGEFAVSGGILQAGVSDVEAMSATQTPEKLQSLVKGVEDEFISNGRAKEILPEQYRKLAFNTPITAERFVSIAKSRGTEDFFSPNLNLEDHAKTFGKINAPILVLPGSKDEFVAKSTDQSTLLQDWKNATDPYLWSDLSHVIEGANHKIDDKSSPGALDDAVDTITKFLTSLI